MHPFAKEPSLYILTNHLDVFYMTNAAAIGYMIRAAKQAELDAQTIRLLESCMREQMDFHDEEEAEKSYHSF